MAAVLAIDVGDKKIGLAVGDTETRMAFARPPLLVETWDEAWAPLHELLQHDRITSIVVGWPMNTDGTAGPQTERVQQFVDHLQQIVSIPVQKRDERMSSQAVQREQQQAGQKLTRGQEDSLAAQLLLESFLNEHQ